MVEKNLKTRYRVWTTSYVNPITGEDTPISYSRVLKKTETKQELAVKQQKSQPEASKNSVVPSLDDLVDVYWHDSIFGEHECGVCGIKRMTSWQAKTTKGAKIPICEVCQQEFYKRREVS